MILWFCNAESSNHTREKDHNTLNVGMKLFKMLLMKREQAHTKKWVSYRFSSLSCLESLQQLGRSCLSHQSITRYPEAPFLGQIKSGFLFFKHLQFEPVSHTLLKCNIFFFVRWKKHDHLSSSYLLISFNSKGKISMSRKVFILWHSLESLLCTLPEG